MKARRIAAMTLGATIVTSLLVASPGIAGAQQYSPLVLGVDYSALRVARDVATAQLLTGQILGANAAVSFRRLQLEGQYAEGSLTPDGVVIADAEDFVEARLLARVRVLPWLSVGGGPHLRAFVTPSGTARWSRLEAHTRVEGELIAGLAQLRVDTWYAFSTDVNVQDGGDGALGGEAGLTIRVPGTPTALHVSYVADQASFANGGTEFVDGLRVSLVLDRIIPARAARRTGPAPRAR